MIEVKHFRLLAAIVEHGTLSAAARALGYSQPAVTQQIQVLERHLRTPVLVRSGGGVRLSEAGQVLVRHGAEVLALVARARAEVEAVADLRAGRVRLACFPSGAAMVLPRALGAVGRRHPGLSFSLTETEPVGAYDLLRRGEVDVAVVYHYRSREDGASPDLRPDETAATLLEEAVHVALPAGHPAAQQPAVDLADLRADRWIAGCPQCRGHLVAACGAVGYEPDIAFETDDYAALQALAAAGLGVALLPELMHAAARADPNLVVRRLRPVSIRVAQAVTTTGLLRVPAVAQTMQALVEAARAVELDPVGEPGC